MGVYNDKRKAHGITNITASNNINHHFNLFIYLFFFKENFSLFTLPTLTLHTLLILH